jgi:hypothetical protein
MKPGISVAVPATTAADDIEELGQHGYRLLHCHGGASVLTRAALALGRRPRRA